MPDRRHLWRGIHDPETVKGALRITLEAERPGDEAVVTLTKRWIGAYRFDVFDPDTDADDDAVRAHTVSTTFQADDHLYLTAEYQRSSEPEAESWAAIANARLAYQAFEQTFTGER